MASKKDGIPRKMSSLDNLVGAGYKGLGEKELSRRMKQSARMYKGMQAEADKYNRWATAISSSTYIDFFGDEKWARKRAAGYQKSANQWEKQYNKLGKHNG